MSAALDALLEELSSHPEADWLKSVLGSPAELGRAFAAATRRFGKGPDVAARVALLLAAPPDPASAQLLYDTADTREKIALLRALPLLPGAERFLPLALDAGRTNDTELFRAVACDNPFPARHYPELEFNKLVMKAAFVGAPVDRIAGLEQRANAELSRMVMDYIDEQESAQRRFPPEIWLAVAHHPVPGAAARMLGYLGHSTAEQRLGAARALAVLRQPRTRSFIQERLEIEVDQTVRELLASALREIPE